MAAKNDKDLDALLQELDKTFADAPKCDEEIKQAEEKLYTQRAPPLQPQTPNKTPYRSPPEPEPLDKKLIDTYGKTREKIGKKLGEAYDTFNTYADDAERRVDEFFQSDRYQEGKEKAITYAKTTGTIVKNSANMVKNTAIMAWKRVAPKKEETMAYTADAAQSTCAAPEAETQTADAAGTSATKACAYNTNEPSEIHMPLDEEKQK